MTHGTKGYKGGYCPKCGQYFMISPYGRRDNGEKEPVWYFARRSCSHISVEQAKRLVFAKKGEWHATREAIRAEIEEKIALWARTDGAAKVKRAKENRHRPLLARIGLYGPILPS